MFQNLLTVALGGAIGASARYLSNVASMRLFGPSFPWSTVFVNVVGSFLMGVIVIVLAEKGGDVRVGPVILTTRQLGPFLMTGILGGFTTFSAFSLDTMTLFERGQTGLAALYAGGSVVLSLAAIAAGLYLARSWYA